MSSELYNVALKACPDYTQSTLDLAVAEALWAAGVRPGAGARVLLKPNLLRPHVLTCASAEVIAAACKYLKDFDLNLTVGDSPGFGSAKSVAKFIGLSELLRPLGLGVTDLNKSRRVLLSGAQTSLAVSTEALDADLIISLPRLKAHQHMGLTLAVKNCFGCIAGLGKARVHTSHGNSHTSFAQLILELYAALPPVAALLDGVMAMHVTGPSAGKPYNAGLLAAAGSALALDTALYAMLGLAPAEAPLWQEALNMNLPGAHPKELAWPLQSWQDFDLTDFEVPALHSPSFHPWFLTKSLCRRIWSKIFLWGR